MEEEEPVTQEVYSRAALDGEEHRPRFKQHWKTCGTRGRCLPTCLDQTCRARRMQAQKETSSQDQKARKQCRPKGEGVAMVIHLPSKTSKQLEDDVDAALGLDGNRLGVQSPLSSYVGSGSDRSRSPPANAGQNRREDGWLGCALLNGSSWGTE